MPDFVHLESLTAGVMVGCASGARINDGRRSRLGERVRVALVVLSRETHLSVSRGRIGSRRFIVEMKDSKRQQAGRYSRPIIQYSRQPLTTNRVDAIYISLLQLQGRTPNMFSVPPCKGGLSIDSISFRR